MSSGLSPAPKSISLATHGPKTVPQAQVAPMKHPDSKDMVPPPQAKAEENDYVVPDEDFHKVKKGKLFIYF